MYGTFSKKRAVSVSPERLDTIDEHRSNRFFASNAHTEDHDYEEWDGEDSPPLSPSAHHLDAIANVPWNIFDARHDRQTQQTARSHYEKYSIYNAMPPDQKQFYPRVHPYPETPDKIFYPTPCFKLLIGDVHAKIFILDPANGQNFPDGWDGSPRQQSSAYWIVPHFIYRDEIAVRNAKTRYQITLDQATIAGVPHPPNKFYYDSRTYVAHFPADIVGTERDGDSFYVEPTANTNPRAPEIVDPIFHGAFNPTRLPDSGLAAPLGFVAPLQIELRVRPFPYNQPGDIFPSQPIPRLIRRPNPIPAPPGAGGGGGRGGGRGGRGGRGGGGGGAPPPAPPAPAGAAAAPAAPPAAAGRGRAAVFYLPHEDQLIAKPPTYQGMAGVDWIDIEPHNIEISGPFLKTLCEEAEELDYSFAILIQGLRGSALNAVWTCLDPEYMATDRQPMMEQFVRSFVERFYGQVAIEGGADVADVVMEALRMHEEFCRGWVSTHHRNFSAEVLACSETLVGFFLDAIKAKLPSTTKLTRTHIARFLRRHPDYASEFSLCLYHFQTANEHTRGNRNPSYKAMTGEANASQMALRRLGALIQSNLGRITTQIQEAVNHGGGLTFNRMFIDWYHISRQLPQIHKEFNGYSSAFQFFSRMGDRRGQLPPWNVGRIRR